MQWKSLVWNKSTHVRPYTFIRKINQNLTEHAYIRNLAAQIVDKLIVDEKSYNCVVQNVLEEQRHEQARPLEVDATKHSGLQVV